jgi:hypothetical protein
VLLYGWTRNRASLSLGEPEPAPPAQSAPR